MEPPSTLPEKRVRKRSKRISETDSVDREAEPARKRPKRGAESGKKLTQAAEGDTRRVRRGSRDKIASLKVG